MAPDEGKQVGTGFDVAIANGFQMIFDCFQIKCPSGEAPFSRESLVENDNHKGQRKGISLKSSCT